MARIFIFPGAKVQMCEDAGGDRAWLRKVRPWWGHDTHFHVRLTCPRGAAGCVDQDPPPPGDGCAEARAVGAQHPEPAAARPERAAAAAGARPDPRRPAAGMRLRPVALILLVAAGCSDDRADGPGGAGGRASSLDYDLGFFGGISGVDLAADGSGITLLLDSGAPDPRQSLHRDADGRPTGLRRWLLIPIEVPDGLRPRRRAARHRGAGGDRGGHLRVARADPCGLAHRRDRRGRGAAAPARRFRPAAGERVARGAGGGRRRARSTRCPSGAGRGTGRFRSGATPTGAWTRGLRAAAAGTVPGRRRRLRAGRAALPARAADAGAAGFRHAACGGSASRTGGSRPRRRCSRPRRHPRQPRGAGGLARRRRARSG